MEDSRQQHHQILVALLTCCAIMFFLPRTIVDSIRTGLGDVLVPGQRVLLAMHETIADDTEKLAANQADPEDSAADYSAELRQRDLQIAELRQQLDLLKQAGRSPFDVAESEPLIRQQALRARVVSRVHPELPTSITIDRGQQGDVDVDLLVVDADSESTMLIDQGTNADLRVGDLAMLGRSVVGRVKKAGLFSSAVQRITDPDYSSGAELFRKTTDGIQFRSKGILEGAENGLCRLTGIPYDSSVTVGDEVFTPASGVFPRMYLGTVIQANLHRGASWDIVVRPQVNFQNLKHVHVLRARVNEKRLADL